MTVNVALLVALCSIISALIGYVGAVATFQARFKTIDVQLAGMIKQIERDRASDKDALKLQIDFLNASMSRIERQSSATLQLVANLAHKHGVDSRSLGVDFLANVLADKE